MIDLPDELEIDLGDRDAGIVPGMRDGNGHVGFRAGAEIDRTEPKMIGDCLCELRLGGIVLLACDDIRLEPRYLQLLLAAAVEELQFRDRRRLP